MRAALTNATAAKADKPRVAFSFAKLISPLSRDDQNSNGCELPTDIPSLTGIHARVADSRWSIHQRPDFDLPRTVTKAVQETTYRDLIVTVSSMLLSGLPRAPDVVPDAHVLKNEG